MTADPNAAALSAAGSEQVQPGPCRCWAVEAHVHPNHCCCEPGATCHASEGQRILEHGGAA